MSCRNAGYFVTFDEGMPASAAVGKSDDMCVRGLFREEVTGDLGLVDAQPANTVAVISITNNSSRGAIGVFIFWPD